MQILEIILGYIVSVINLFSIFVLLAGILISVKDIIFAIIRAIKRTNANSTLRIISSIKKKLGSFILLSLEILIIADIIETIQNPNFREISLLAIIVLIRTLISYFFSKEIYEHEK